VCGGTGTGTTGVAPQYRVVVSSEGRDRGAGQRAYASHMTQLSFIDASSTRMILEAAASLGPSRTVVLRCRPAVEARFTQLGLDLLPHVSLVGVHDQ
jgi:hypothetical protein